MPSSVCAVPDCTDDVRARNWCNRHYRRWLRTGDPIQAAWERGDHVTNFWAKAQRRGPSECWPWTGSLNTGGHGTFVWPGGSLAHRYSYEIGVGPIPEGMELDHLCHSNDPTCRDGVRCLHRRCVNPAHLEPVTRAENQRRRHDLHDRAVETIGAMQRAKTHCPKDHEYTEENTYVDGKGSRNCRTCAREKSRAYSATPEAKAKQRAYYLARKEKQKQHQ